MESGIEIGQIFFQALNILFLFWPDILLIPLIMKGDKLKATVFLWVLLAIIRLIYAVSGYPQFTFPSEPLYTVIFALTGFVLLAIWIVKKRPNRSLERIRDEG